MTVGPAADPDDFNPESLQNICATITVPFGFPETREIYCDRYLRLFLYSGH